MGELKDFKDQMKERTRKFAHACVKFSIDLPNNTLGTHIRKQLIRAATSVAANYRASCIAQSVPQIISKLSIAIEESDECEFWLEFSKNENLDTSDLVRQLTDEAHQISSILIVARRTLQNQKK
jgi:four helix bundle protein